MRNTTVLYIAALAMLAALPLSGCDQVEKAAAEVTGSNIKGTVTDGSKAVDGVTVTAFNLASAENWDKFNLQGYVQLDQIEKSGKKFETTSGADGTYVFEKGTLAPGLYIVIAGKAGLPSVVKGIDENKRLTQKDMVEVTTGETTVDFVITSGTPEPPKTEYKYSLQVTIATSDGKPPADAVVALDGNPGSGIGGVFTFANIAKGTHQVKASMDGYTEATKSVAVAADPTTLTVTLQAKVSATPTPAWTSFQATGKTGTVLADASQGDATATTPDRLVIVKGQVTGTGITTAVLSVCGVEQTVAVVSGVIKTSDSDSEYEGSKVVIPISGCELKLRASNEGGTTESHVITVKGINPKPFTVVLTWDTTDTDVDLHTWDSTGTETWYMQMQTTAGTLDIDNTSGYGPETFTGTGTGQYKVRVNMFSMHGTKAATNAIVKIYKNGTLVDTKGPHAFTTDQGAAAWWDVGSF